MPRKIKTYVSYVDCEKFFRVFDSPKALSFFIKNTAQTSTGKKYGNVQIDTNKKFYGTANWDEAEMLLVNGDFENMKKINIAAVTNDINGGGVEKKNTLRNSPVGFLPVVPKVLSGCPDNMLTINKRLTASTKILNICYNCSVAYFINTDDMIKTAANVATVIRGLEKNGFRINMYVAGVGRTRTQAISIAVKVKNSGEYLDMLRLAYPLINPSFFRRHFLASMERIKGFKLTKNYGVVPDTTFSKKAVEDMFKGKNVKYLDFETCKNKTTNDILKILTSGN